MSANDPEPALTVDTAFRDRGAGKALSRFAIARARDIRRNRLVLRTTRVMQIAWAMYEGLGFVRFPEIHFRQGSLDVFGFRLDLTAP